MTTGNVYMRVQLDELDIARIAAVIRSRSHTDLHPRADDIAREIAETISAQDLIVSVRIPEDQP